MLRSLVAVVVFLMAASLACQQPADAPDAPDAPEDGETRARAAAMSEKFTKYAEHDPAVGTPAPDFTLSTLDGEEVRMADFLGNKYVVLEFGSYT